MTPNERRKGIFILFLVTIMAMLETLGIASLMPFLAVLSDPSLLQNNLILSKAYQFSLELFIKDEDEFLFCLVFFLLQLLYQAQYIRY